MKSQYRTHPIVEVVSLFICLAGLAGGDSWADEDTKYLDAVRMFADNVLEHGRDVYGSKYTHPMTLKSMRGTATTQKQANSSL